MKDFAVCGLGNAIVDIFVEVTDEEFAPLGFERGTMRLVDSAEQRGLLERLHARAPRLDRRSPVLIRTPRAAFHQPPRSET